jgi:hypothetical protein
MRFASLLPLAMRDGIAIILLRITVIIPYKSTNLYAFTHIRQLWTHTDLITYGYHIHYLLFSNFPISDVATLQGSRLLPHPPSVDDM